MESDIVEKDAYLVSFMPHMHFRGKDFSLYKVENPQTAQQRKHLIMRIGAYDFNWQRTYEFQRPIELKSGDALYSVALFDNSHYNPNNPDPQAQVKYGLLSEDEMLNIRVKFERVDLGP